MIEMMDLGQQDTALVAVTVAAVMASAFQGRSDFYCPSPRCRVGAAAHRADDVDGPATAGALEAQGRTMLDGAPVAESVESVGI